MTKPDPTVSESAAGPGINPGPPGLAERLAGWSAAHPVQAVLLVALLAVVINCYPVIFCGRSYVSPACAGPMVYSVWPPLPGMQRTPPVPKHGSDTWAMMLWSVPCGFIESRSLWQYGELPLWNRYSQGGETFIGQAITMLGDPMQLIVVLGGGSALAWDVKFLAAKFLFCVGFGLLIRRWFGSLPLALLYTALAAYCGAFFYIQNHPAFFVFVYAPWILLSASAWLDLKEAGWIGWGLVWLLAGFGCFNAGHVEPAVVLIGGLNLAALAGALAMCRRPAEVAGVLGRLAAGTLLFLGLTAPMWLSFLVSLRGAFTLHADVLVKQLPFANLPGLFDDIFYQCRVGNDSALAPAPGTSLLILTGCVFSVWGWRQMRTDVLFWINGAAILWWIGCVFGLIPAPVLAAIPLLNRVGHTQSDFSYLLVVHLTLQSAYGFRCLARAGNFRQVLAGFAGVLLVLGALLALYCRWTPHRPLAWNYLACAGAGAIGAPGLYAFWKCRHGRISLAGWTGILVLGLAAQFRFGLYNFGNEELLMLAGPRWTLDHSSPSIDAVKSDGSGPFRVVGLEWNLFGDYAAVYGLEDIRSCAPLSNPEFVDLVWKFPGMSFGRSWWIEVTDPAAAQPLLSLLNVKYLLATPGAALPKDLHYRVLDGKDFWILENPDVWPRAFFSDKVVALASNDDFVKRVQAAGKQPFIALTAEELAGQPGLRALATPGDATVVPGTHYRLLPNSTAFDIHAPSAGMVYLTEGQARDFVARANQQPLPVLTVNRAFKGIYLDRPGDYHVEFRYRPRHWRWACAGFWGALGIIVAFAGRHWISTRARRRIGPPGAERPT